MKRLLFIIMICIGCHFGPPKKLSEKVPKPGEDSVFIKSDTDNARLNFVVLDKNRYFFKGELSGSTILEFIPDSTMLDSLAESSIGSDNYLNVYAPPEESLEDVIKVRKVLIGKKIKFHLVVDDGLKSLRRSNDRKGYKPN